MKSTLARVFAVAAPGVYFLHCAMTASAWHFIDTVDLIFHEAGHTLFSFFGDFIHILMGSGFQVLLPLALAGYFFYTRQQIATAFALMWTGQSLINVSVYAGDAVAMQLPLLGGDGVMHDWNYLLTTLNVLRYTPQIASGIYALGLFFILAGIALGLYFTLTPAKPVPSII